MIRTPEQLEAEVRAVYKRWHIVEQVGEVKAWAAFAATIQQDAFSAGRLDVLDGENVRAVLEKTRQDAVDEERKALREIFIREWDAGHNKASILAALDARSKR